MQLSQRVEIPVARESVWLALNDHKILMQCLPGCEQFEPSEENCFTIVLLAKVGPVKARFQGQVELSDIHMRPVMCCRAPARVVSRDLLKDRLRCS